MTEIFLVRHPESHMNVRPDLIGGRSLEAPITARGAEQAHRFGRAFLDTYGMPDYLASSSAVRTQTLINIFAEEAEASLPVEVSDALLEMSQGDFEGLLRADIYTDQRKEEINLHQKNFKLPGGESMEDVADRMLEWMYRHESNDTAMILAATHGLATRCLVGRILGWSQDEIMAYGGEFDNVSSSSFTVEDSKISVNFYGKDIIEPVPRDWY